jgi:hypothetical protein
MLGQSATTDDTTVCPAARHRAGPRGKKKKPGPRDEVADDARYFAWVRSLPHYTLSRFLRKASRPADRSAGKSEPVTARPASSPAPAASCWAYVRSWGTSRWRRGSVPRVLARRPGTGRRGASGPPARAARRPVGPGRNMIPGCSPIRRASSMSRFAADDRDMPGVGGCDAEQLSDGGHGGTSVVPGAVAPH